MNEISFSEAYHEETKYSLKTLQSLPRPDWSQKPSLFKEFHEPCRHRLRAHLRKSPFPRPPAAFPLKLEVLSRILMYTYGVTRVVRNAQEDFYMRAAPSAGGLYPCELYVAVREVEGLPPGLYNYQCRDHSLVLLWEGDFSADLDRFTREKGVYAKCPFAVILTGVFLRSAWRYHDRAYRRVCLDTGHVVGNLLLAARAEGLAAVPTGGFLDAGINDLLFLDDTKEGALAVVAVGSAEATAGMAQAVLPSRRTRGDEVERKEGILAALHACSSIRSEDVAELERVVLPEPRELKDALPLDGAKAGLEGKDLCLAFLKRRSTRAFSGSPIERKDLASILEFSYRRDARQLRGIAPQLLRTFLAVNRVDGLDAGLYELDTKTLRLAQVKRGSPSTALHEITLGQELGRDAACTVIHIASLPEAVQRLGDRAYRYLHLDAGIIGQKINLAAVHLGIGVSGIGGFLDDRVNQLLDLPSEYGVVYLTVLGAPAPRQAWV